MAHETSNTVTLGNLLTTFPKSYSIENICTHFSQQYKEITHLQFPHKSFKHWAYKFKDKYTKKHRRRDQKAFLRVETTLLDTEVNPRQYGSPEATLTENDTTNKKEFERSSLNQSKKNNLSCDQCGFAKIPAKVTVGNLLSKTFPKSYSVENICTHFSEQYEEITGIQYPAISFKYWTYKFKDKYTKKHRRDRKAFLGTEKSFLDYEMNPSEFVSSEAKSPTVFCRCAMEEHKEAESINPCDQCEFEGTDLELHKKDKHPSDQSNQVDEQAKVKVTVGQLLSTYPKSYSVDHISKHFSRQYTEITRIQYPPDAFRYWAEQFKDKYKRQSSNRVRNQVRFQMTEKTFLNEEVDPSEYASPPGPRKGS